MAFEYGVRIWSSERWRDSATAWADARLSAAGIERTGELEQPRLRPWATVLRIPTTVGPVWLKATGPAVAFEAGLYELLTSAVPSRVLEPIALDVERGWLLLPDGGPSLGERLGPDEPVGVGYEGPNPLIDALAQVLPLYGRLQRDLAPRADEMLALGVADMTPSAMPERFDEALGAARSQLGGSDRSPLRDGVAEVARMREQVIEWCRELAAGPVPASIDHNDLHAWNMLGDPEAVRFYDWGDAVVAHPFASMLSLGWVKMEEADVLRLRDAYLAEFADLGPHDQLVRQLELACRVGKIARSLTWQRAITASGPDEVEKEWVDAPAESLVALLDDTWLGRT